MVTRWAMLAVAALLAACATPPPCDTAAADRLTVTLLRGVPIVQAHVNGAPAPFLLDTGATTTVMLPEGVEQLRLPLDPGRVTRARGVGGSFTAPNVLIRELRLGRRVAEGLSVPVIAHALPGQRVMAGVLGADLLAAGDFGIDMPLGQVTLQDARVCPAGPPPWTGAYDSIPVRVLPGGWVLVQVQVDGQPVEALLDTGAAASTIRDSTALRLGMPPAVLSQPVVGQVHGAGQDRLDVRLHRFGAVRVGQEVLPNLALGVTALPAEGFDMILGQDYMRTRRLWLSYGQQRLYVQRAVAAR